ncbi:MAG: diacylglycerol kinase family lipid kinase [Verrucomicrobiales bacterium]|nr:diacylglycerol kinase family lipid kinase [Verrucomicrobiales bacterium]
MDDIPVIFNPCARSATAESRLEAIRELSPRIRLCPTLGPGDARRLARELAQSGHSTVVAAGGDGTVNEVVNGLADAGPATQSALGLLPAGTMNVFAVEMGLPARDLQGCWNAIERGHVREVDLWKAGEHCFVQLAGVGLDAEIIRETTWESKKALGPLSYILSAARLLGRDAPLVAISADGREPTEGSVVLIGNGKRYGGPFKIFPAADNSDGLLDVIVLRRHGYGPLFSGLFSLLTRGYEKASSGDFTYFQTARLEIRSEENVPVEADGELVGTAPVTVANAGHRLRVIC